MFKYSEAGRSLMLRIVNRQQALADR